MQLQEMTLGNLKRRERGRGRRRIREIYICYGKEVGVRLAINFSSAADLEVGSDHAEHGRCCVLDTS